MKYFVALVVVLFLFSCDNWKNLNIEYNNVEGNLSSIPYLKSFNLAPVNDSTVEVSTKYENTMGIQTYSTKVPADKGLTSVLDIYLTEVALSGDLFYRFIQSTRNENIRPEMEEVFGKTIQDIILESGNGYTGVVTLKEKNEQGELVDQEINFINGRATYKDVKLLFYHLRGNVYEFHSEKAGFFRLYKFNKIYRDYQGGLILTEK